MKKLLLLSIGLCFFIEVDAQSGFPKYYAFIALWQRGDSLYQAQHYKEAAKSFHQAARSEIEKGVDVPRSDAFLAAACAYALAGDAKGAFTCLDALANELNYRELEKLQTDADLAILQKDKRWAAIINTIRTNKVRHDRNETIYRQRTTVAPDFKEVVFYPHAGSFIDEILHLDTLPFVSVSHELYRLHFSADSYAASHLAEIKTAITDAYYRAIHLLGIDGYHRGIDLVLFNSVEEMKQVSGVRAQGGIAYPEFDAGIFPIHGMRRPQFKHEIFHILSLNTWGACTSRLLIEGSAVYADNECHYDNPIFAYNAYLVKNDMAISLDSLIHHFDEIAIKNDVIAYLQSAGVFKYLYEKYGIEKMKALWIEGFGAFERIYGFPVQQLESDWRQYMQGIPLPAGFDFGQFKEGCG